MFPRSGRNAKNLSPTLLTEAGPGKGFWRLGKAGSAYRYRTAKCGGKVVEKWLLGRVPGQHF